MLACLEDSGALCGCFMRHSRCLEARKGNPGQARTAFCPAEESRLDPVSAGASPDPPKLGLCPYLWPQSIPFPPITALSTGESRCLPS